jgi:anti-sigma B factor antagonist
MDDGSYPVTIINDVPVITPPGEIDATTAGQLCLALLEAAANGRQTIVVDMTRTGFCDSAGLTVLVQAYQRALTGGGELRLVIPAGSAVFRILAITGLHRLIPRYDSLSQALRPPPAAVIPRPRPRPAPGLPRLPRQATAPDGGA